MTDITVGETDDDDPRWIIDETVDADDPPDPGVEDCAEHPDDDTEGMDDVALPVVAEEPDPDDYVADDYVEDEDVTDG